MMESVKRSRLSAPWLVWMEGWDVPAPREANGKMGIGILHLVFAPPGDDKEVEVFLSGNAGRTSLFWT